MRRSAAKTRFAVVLALGVVVAAGVVLALRNGADGAPSPTTRSAHPPVVMVVLDEVSLVALLDSTGHIDPVRYPNIARLAADGTLFRNFTALRDDTSRVVSTLLAGKPYRLGSGPYDRYYPHNIFTLLGGGTYDIDAAESEGWMCPHRICSISPRNPPKAEAARVLGELAKGRSERFRAWIRSIDGSRTPTFYFAHLLLPHGPWIYLPTGQAYRHTYHEPLPGMSGPTSDRSPWFLVQAYQRHLLQAMFVDRLIGELVARLKAQGLYDRSAIMLTADNGEGFLFPGSAHHRADPRTFADVAATPLIIKRPFEHRAAISGRHLRTIDIAATVADLARLPMYRSAGRSAFATQARRPKRVRIIEDGGAIDSISIPGFDRRVRASVARKVRIFGQHDRTGVYEPGPDRALLGRAPRSAGLPVAARGPLRVKLTDPLALNAVHPHAYYVPADITGRMTGTGAQAGIPLAVALNGRIRATGLSARVPGDKRTWVSIFVPPTALREGHNALALYRIDRGPRGVRLVPLG